MRMYAATILESAPRRILSEYRHGSRLKMPQIPNKRMPCVAAHAGDGLSLALPIPAWRQTLNKPCIGDGLNRGVILASDGTALIEISASASPKTTVPLGRGPAQDKAGESL